jgi:hypothetical protein
MRKRVDYTDAEIEKLVLREEQQGYAFDSGNRRVGPMKSADDQFELANIGWWSERHGLFMTPVRGEW